MSSPARNAWYECSLSRILPPIACLKRSSRHLPMPSASPERSASDSILRGRATSGASNLSRIILENARYISLLGMVRRTPASVDSAVRYPVRVITVSNPLLSPCRSLDVTWGSKCGSMRPSLPNAIRSRYIDSSWIDRRSSMMELALVLTQ